MSLVKLPEKTLVSKITTLRDRAAMLGVSRRFFQELGVLEVDTPACTAQACVDANIDLFCVIDGRGNTRYLHSSPEYGMKRLLTEGIGDIYQISHVFRNGEKGQRHNPEFTMTEWYRCNIDLETMIAETAAYIGLFLGELPLETLTYRAALHAYAGIDYTHASAEDLVRCLHSHKIDVPESIIRDGVDALLNLLMGTVVEKHLGIRQLTAITDYPASQCALAEIEISDGIGVSKRFEIYYEGNELANGYQEEKNAYELRARFNRANIERNAQGKPVLPLDEQFLLAMENGLPPCCGVAVGFDRLMMLRHETTNIQDIIPYFWDEA